MNHPHHGGGAGSGGCVCRIYVVHWAKVEVIMGLFQGNMTLRVGVIMDQSWLLVVDVAGGHGGVLVGG